MSSSYILGGCRTPLGKLTGNLASVSATELGADAVADALRRTETDPDSIDEVILGLVLSAGVGQAPARQAALRAGIPDRVAALTVNKVCGSGLKAVMLADQAIRAGDASRIVAGGMENMSRAPHLVTGARSGWKFGDQKLVDSMILDGLYCSIDETPMGHFADEIARRYNITREQQDSFSAESHRRAVAARETAREEITPVTIRSRRGESLVEEDEGPRSDASTKTLAKLRPAFDSEGTVTAGNASQISDGAAALIVVSEPVAQKSSSPLKARIVASATSGGAPRDLFIAPVSAIESVLQKAGLKIDQIDRIELNEAFAAQCLACTQLLDIDPKTINPEGGAIALGHPLGASGARVLVTLLHGLARDGLQRGLVSLCLGGGNAVAMIVERE